MGVETRMGGSRDSFPDTAWSTVLSCPDPASAPRRAALSRLLERYWRPIYRFVRASGRSVEDAKDLTQGFVCHMIEDDIFARYRSEKGRFRHFLKGALRNFIAMDRREASALKRGGGHPVLSLDVSALEAAPPAPDTRELTPDRIFDRQWAADVLKDAVTALQNALEREGKRECLAVYRAYELSDEAPTYEYVARSLRLTASQVKEHLDSARQRLQQILTTALADSVSNQEELAQELKDLLQP